MITWINELKTLKKHISWERKWKFNGRNVIQINGGITINVDVGVKNVMYVKRNYICDTFACIWKNGKYLASIMADSSITWVEVLESYYKETKNIPTSFNEKKAIYKTQNFYILVTFLLIYIASLIAVRIYCYLIKYQVIEKHLLPLRKTNNKLKQVLFW